MYVCAGFGETDEVKCGYDGCQTGEPGLEACWPIPVPDHDPDFRFNNCLKFVRSQGTPPLKCSFGKWIRCQCCKQILLKHTSEIYRELVCYYIPERQR